MYSASQIETANEELPIATDYVEKSYQELEKSRERSRERRENWIC
jgi:hypothetical protein